MAKGRRDGQRMIIISLDAVGERDLAFLSQLPNFRRIRETASYCDHVRSVYPSVTYPAHTTIVTGLRPAQHGVVNNLRIQPERNGREDWLWHRKYVKSDTIYDAARRAGYVTASLLWPVTARSRIRYCVPEIFPNRSWQNQVMVSAVNGPMSYQIELLKRFGHQLDGTKQPFLDNFVTDAAEYTIFKYNPDLFLIHLTDVDTHRHLYGVEAPQVQEAMRRHDERLGRLLQALEKTGDMERTTVVVLGDHCQIDVHTAVYPNYYLKKAGYITCKGDKIDSYDFYAQHCDGCCYIYASQELLRDMKEMSKEERRSLMQTLNACLCQIPKEMIERIVLRREIKKLGADENCICMLEAKPGYYFQNEFEKPHQKVDAMIGHRMRATHGYMPDIPGYETFFMMSGYGVKPGEIRKEMRLYDEALILAEILGVTLKQKTK